jgi:hypothetical protein
MILGQAELVHKDLMAVMVGAVLPMKVHCGNLAVVAVVWALLVKQQKEHQLIVEVMAAMD